MPLITIVDNDNYKTKEAPLPTYIEGPPLLPGPDPRIINQNDFDDLLIHLIICLFHQKLKLFYHLIIL